MVHCYGNPSNKYFLPHTAQTTLPSVTYQPHFCPGPYYSLSLECSAFRYPCNLLILFRFLLECHLSERTPLTLTPQTLFVSLYFLSLLIFSYHTHRYICVFICVYITRIHTCVYITYIHIYM